MYLIPSWNWKWFVGIKLNGFIVIIVFILTCCIVPYLGLIVLVIFFIYTGLKPDQPITKSSNLTTQDTPEVLLFSFRENKRAYLRSELWKFKKKERLKLDKYTCQSCGITGVELHIHHLSEYNNLNNEAAKLDTEASNLWRIYELEC